MRVVLASGSPRRRDLLSREGVLFEVRSADVDESLDDELASRPHDAAKQLASRKAEAVAKDIAAEADFDGNAGVSFDETLVVGSDTMVVLGSRIYGKPVDKQDAAGMLKSLSGKTHEVITGVSVWRVFSEGGKIEMEGDSFEETSYVTFKELSSEDIAEYIACGESHDKAGAYAVQGEGARLVERFDGDYDNIVGLPVKRLLESFPQLKA